MRKFVRQKPNNTTAADITIDFGAASAQIAQRARSGGLPTFALKSARVIQNNQNTLVALDLIEIESGAHVANLPIWVDGPNANAGRLVAENRHLIAQLLNACRASQPRAMFAHLSPNWPD